MSTFLHACVEGADGLAIVNRRTGRPLVTTIEAAFDSLTRRRGLLGRTHLDEGRGLVIAPCNAIHMFFMRFPIDVVFAARDGRVVAIRRGVKPWRIALSPRAFAAIELPVGAIDASGTRPDDDLLITRSSPRA